MRLYIGPIQILHHETNLKFIKPPRSERRAITNLSTDYVVPKNVDLHVGHASIKDNRFYIRCELRSC